jgi:flagellar biosynthesis/type III secretory pathway ATPase
MQRHEAGVDELPTGPGSRIIPFSNLSEVVPTGGVLRVHAEVELLLRVGECKSGSDPVADEAVAKIDRLRSRGRARMRGRGSWP